jgi:hypothetical protein
LRKSRRVGYCRERCYHWLAISYLALPMLRMATAALSCSPATDHELLVRAAEVSRSYSLPPRVTARDITDGEACADRRLGAQV